ncbi:MAG: TM2 domain-containing protein [Flavobacteriales bacterium]|nr:TM2 domain-containing protein [Flavobacteriales bacterium]
MSLPACALALGILIGSAGRSLANEGGPYRRDHLPFAVIADSIPTIPAERAEPKRWIAAVLTVGLGPFGAHRLYLGTKTKVPIIYGITFGGFGVIPLIDLIEILFTKDLSSFERNGKVLMWSGPPPPVDGGT